jgi:DNA topoisomerase-3
VLWNPPVYTYNNLGKILFCPKAALKKAAAKKGGDYVGKILVVAEKPSVGRDIAKVLGCKEKGDGFLSGEKYIVSWAVGHLITLCDPEDYDVSLKKWRIETLPILPEKIKTKAIKNTYSQLKVLKSLMNDKETEYIICATDSGREGELIFRYIYNYVRCKKQFKRLWISSMTDAAIKEGFENIKDSSFYDNLYLSAKCRSEADWLVGINASRAYTLRYNVLLSIGRVQTPTLAIMVMRHEEIEKFESKEYYEVKTNYGDFGGIWFDGEYSNTKIFSKEEAEKKADKVQGKKGIVEKCEKEEKRQLPPLLYDLTELQREANRIYGYSAQKTLTIAQSLYEKRKMITYPRTDSRYLSDDMIPKIKSTLKKLLQESIYAPYAEKILSLEKLPISKRIIDNSKVSDHHAIIPTDGRINVSALSVEEKNIFNLVALRFMAVFYQPYVYEVTRVVVKAENETFLSKGTHVLDLGWTVLIVKSKEKKENSDEEYKIPNVSVGDEVEIIKAEAVKNYTKPPKPYTEATLLTAMENAGKFVEDENLKEQMKESGLGTPATRAAIIERLIDVGYVQRKGKALLPTEKGISLINIVPSELKSPETTGKWEKGLSSISKGKMTDERFMGSIRRFVCYIIDESAKVNSEIKFEKEERTKKGRAKSLGKCPLCGKGEIYENTKAYYCTAWKDGCKFSVWKDCLDRCGNSMDRTKMKKLLKTGSIENVDIILPQTGEKGKATLFLNKDKNYMAELMNFKKEDV